MAGLGAEQPDRTGDDRQRVRHRVLTEQRLGNPCTGGIDRHRPLPKFAPLTLQEWFVRRGGSPNPLGREVVVFPDTFNNHFHTDVGVACVEAIEAAGWKVVMPTAHICCGRPLYDYGFLDVAERYLRDVLTQLRPYLRNGTPIVGLEPSCLAVFKDELTKVLPHDDDASRLCRQAYHFAEFFDAFDIEVPSLHAKAVLWGDCHHRATGGIEPEEKLLSRMGVDATKAQGGCCGLAGSWGFESGKWQISMDCGEEGLFRAVRNADRTTLVVADGFSCKTQLQHAQGAKRGIDREALHVGQVLAMARTGQPGAKPKPPVLRRLARTLGPLAIGTAAIATGVRRLVLR